MTLGVEIICGFFLEREDEAYAIGHIVEPPNVVWIDRDDDNISFENWTLMEESRWGDLMFCKHVGAKYVRHLCPANWKMI